jgi:hypothetical protein
MHRQLLCLSATLSLLGFAGVSEAEKKTKHVHQHMHHALWELRHAEKELRESKVNFGDHRAKAEAAIADAIKQIDIALTKAGDAPSATPTKRDLQEEYKKYASHPHLHHALHELKHAHTQLKEAKHDFGGHREEALRSVDHAIHQVTILLEHIKKAG